MNDVFTYDFEKDALERTEMQSLAVEKLSQYCRQSINSVKQTIDHRQEVLSLLQEKQVRRFEDVNKFLWKYYEQRAFAPEDAEEENAGGAKSKGFRPSDEDQTTIGL